MTEIRIGIVGLGGICRQRHIPGLLRIPGVELVAVANSSLESTRKAAAEFAIPHACASWEEVVQHREVNAVLIGTWPYLHHPISIAALEAGKDVFCQARMAMNAAEAREMCEVWRRSGRVAMLCPVPFGLSIDKTIRRLLREDRLGELRLVEVHSLNSNFSDPKVPMSWRKDHRLSGLNALTLGMYIEVIHRWLGKTRKLSGHFQTFTPVRPDQEGNLTPVHIPDQILVHAEMDREIPVQYTFSGVARAAIETITVYGSKGVLFYDSAADSLNWRASDGNLSPVDIQPEDAYDSAKWAVEADFVAAIREGKPYYPNFQDGLEYMETIQAVYDSAAAKCSVTVR